MKGRELNLDGVRGSLSTTVALRVRESVLEGCHLISDVKDKKGPAM